MSEVSKKLRSKIINSMLTAPIVGGNTMGEVLSALASERGIARDDLLEYKQLESAWGSIAEDITEYIEVYANVKLAGDIDELKRIFNEWTPVPQDGGASLYAALVPWVAATTEKKVKFNVS